MNHILAAAILIGTVLVSSCASDNLSGGGNRGVTFAASVGNEVPVNTRAGITFKPVTFDDYEGIPFYIHAEVSAAGGKDELAKYAVAPGMLGRLAAIEGQQEILWYNKKDNHTFYAWTMPWHEDDLFFAEPGASSEVSFLPETYQEMTWLSKEDRLNCGVMEHFIAARTAPLSYNFNGELVEMYFQHLVSKINIEISGIQNGWPNNNGDEAEAEMTFIDMPRKGIFHRHPADGRAPYVEKADAPAAGGVTCQVGTITTTLYVCPEIDFSNMRFAIHINDGYGNRGDYHGDFRSVIFKRPDESLGNWDEGKRTTVLYAGEEMTIRFRVRDDELDNFTVNINPWQERKDRTGVSQAKQGVYTLTELQDIYNRFAGGNYTRPDDVDEIFDLFGTEDENGDKVIYMYDDITTTHGRFPLDQSLILDGMGHVLTTANNSRTVDGTEYKYCARTPCCRNIFLTNGDGEHMIYIDEDYHIWIVDPVTLKMTDSGNELTPRPLQEGQGSYYIDYVTGKVIYISSTI